MAKRRSKPQPIQKIHLDFDGLFRRLDDAEKRSREAADRCHSALKHMHAMFATLAGKAQESAAHTEQLLLPF